MREIRGIRTLVSGYYDETITALSGRPQLSKQVQNNLQLFAQLIMGLGCPGMK